MQEAVSNDRLLASGGMSKNACSLALPKTKVIRSVVRPTRMDDILYLLFILNPGVLGCSVFAAIFCNCLVLVTYVRAKME
jgi:hypothetical protein